MRFMKLNFEKTKNFCLILLLLVISFSICYYFVVLPTQVQEAKEKIEFLKIKQAQENLEKNRKGLDLCLAQADFNYYSCWETQCSMLGKNGDCSLPAYLGDLCREEKHKDKDYCFKKFPVK